MPSICMITSEYEPYIIGGLGVATTHLVRSLIRNNVDVTVIVHSGRIPKLQIHTNNRLRVIRIPQRAPFYIGNQINPSSILPHIRNQTFALVHTQSVSGLRLAKEIRSRRGIPIVYTSHSIEREVVKTFGIHPNRSLQVRQQEQLYRAADRIVVPSLREKRQFGRNYPGLLHKLLVIPLGVESAKQVKRIASNNSFQMVFIGRLNPRKGLVTLLAALPAVVKRYPNTKLIIVGRGSAKYEAVLKGHIKRLNIQKQVIFRKWVHRSKMAEVYAKAAVAVFPSVEESFGLVVLEAMAHGVPVITTITVGVAEAIPSTVITKIVPRNSGQLSNAILRHFSHRIWSQQMGVTAKNWSKRYSWAATGKKYKALYQVLQKKR